MGGGDGALIKELLSLPRPPKFVTMVDIDDVVMNACYKYDAPSYSGSNVKEMPDMLNGVYELLFFFFQNNPVVCGGYTGRYVMNACYKYDAPSNSWSNPGDMTQIRKRATSVKIGDDLWIMGG